MAATDPLGDGLTKISNASRAGHPTVEVRPSNLLTRVLEVLKQEGFIRAYKPTGESAATRRLRVYLKRERRLPAGQAGRPALTKIVRVSKPGKRWYRKAHELPRVRSGLGVAILSTSNGLMTDRSAFHRRVGGEVLCYVW